MCEFRTEFRDTGRTDESTYLLGHGLLEFVVEQALVNSALSNLSLQENSQLNQYAINAKGFPLHIHRPRSEADLRASLQTPAVLFIF